MLRQGQKEGKHKANAIIQAQEITMVQISMYVVEVMEVKKSIWHIL